MKRLLADFNEVYDDECIWTSMRQLQSVLAPGVGETVELYDFDGETCWAVVEQVAGPIVHARLKWETWVSARPSFQVPTPRVVSTDDFSELVSYSGKIEAAA